MDAAAGAVEGAHAIDAMIDESIGTLLVPTIKRVPRARAKTHPRWMAQAQTVVDAAGWTDEGGTADDPLCDTGRVASELGIAHVTARRWMRDGTVPCVTITRQGRQARLARLGDVWALRDRLADRILLPELALELQMRYHELYQLARTLNLTLEAHPTSRALLVHPAAAQAIRDERRRITDLHARSVKVAVAARELGVAASTITVMIKRGDLVLDGQTDGSRARFVTRSSLGSVQRKRLVSPRTGRIEPERLSIAEVIRFTGRSRAEILDLVRAGVLEQVPGRGRCELTDAGLKAWMSTSA